MAVAAAQAASLTRAFERGSALNDVHVPIDRLRYMSLTGTRAAQTNRLTLLGDRLAPLGYSESGSG